MVDLTILAMVASIAIIVAVSWASGEVLIKLISHVSRRAGVEPAQVRSIREWFTLLWIIIAAGAILSVTNLSSQFTTLTISGIVGLAISLALQTTLQNIIAGILMFNDNTLRLHDVVEFAGIKGKVAKVGLRNTWILNDQGNVVLVSNSTLAAGPFINYTALARLTKKLPLTD